MANRSTARDLRLMTLTPGAWGLVVVILMLLGLVIWVMTVPLYV